jgi:quinol monooxygenase YgiN
MRQMDEQVAWHVELAVRPDELEHFRALTSEMVAFTRREPGVLVYERFLSDDGRTVHVYERYTDSAAAVSHLRAFASEFGERFSKLVERKRFLVFGNPSRELRAILDGYGAIYCAPFDGFSRMN